MTTIHKIISFKGQYFVREYETIKHHKNKMRYLREDTVAKQFKRGDCKVVIHFEGDAREITLDNFSDAASIKKYLGHVFLT